MLTTPASWKIKNFHEFTAPTIVFVSLASSSLRLVTVLRHKAVDLEDSACLARKLIISYILVATWSTNVSSVLCGFTFITVGRARHLKTRPLILWWSSYVFNSFPFAFCNSSWLSKTAGCLATKWRLNFIGFVLLLAHTKDKYILWSGFVVTALRTFL